MISVAEAQTRLLALADPLPLETIALRDANGRVFHGDVVADRDQPPFPSSAMDGYAVIDNDHGRWTVIGESAAGHGYFVPIKPGQAVRIFTGAPVPPNANRIVIQEDVARDGNRIRLGPNPDTAAYIRPAGGDFSKGYTFSGPKVLGPAHIALLAAMNAATVTVTRKPVVAILSTGDELVPPGQIPARDQIIASNAVAIAAMVQQTGAIARTLPIARDRKTALIQAFDLAGDADIVLTIGGASVGDHDLVGKVAAQVGFAPQFYKVAMRPGKPLMSGKRGTQIHLGLPGNPVSAMVCGTVYLVPLIKTLLGHPHPLPAAKTATLAHPIAANGLRAHYMRATIDDDTITPFERQDSSLMHVFTQANALLIREPNAPSAPAGTDVPYLPL